MSEVQPPSESLAATDPATSAVAAGAMLREAREATGLHVAALAVSLKVPVKKLEALEAGRLDLLPDAVFARALAATICRGLKIDPAPVLALLPQNTSSRLGVEPPAINTPFHAAGSEPNRSAGVKLSPALLAVGALLLGALVIYVLPPSPRDGGAERAVTESATPLPSGDPVRAEPMADASSAPLAAAAVPQPAALPAGPAASSPMAAAPSAAVPAPVVPAPLATPADGAPGQRVVFVARAETWVQVTDAKGAVTLRRTMKADESEEATGVFPLSVVVGRIDAVEVQVRGKPMDLTSIAKNNVARFEVK